MHPIQPLIPHIVLKTFCKEKQRISVTPTYNQTAEVWRTRATARGIMNHVFLVYTGGDVIPVCLLSTNPLMVVFQVVYGSVCCCEQALRWSEFFSIP